MQENGIGVPVDLRLAFHLYNTAAEGGHVESMHCLGGWGCDVRHFPFSTSSSSSSL